MRYRLDFKHGLEMPCDFDSRLRLWVSCVVPFKSKLELTSTAMSTSPPKATKLDYAHALAKAGLSALPVVGGPAVELFQVLVQPPIERRRTEWMQRVGERLQGLEQQGLKLEDLQTNDQFITAVLQATTVAVRTHQEQKLLALRNAVLNIACGAGPEETIQHLLLSFIDDFSAMHLRVLAFARLPAPPPGMPMGALGHVLENNIPELKGSETLYTQLWKDLYVRGLVNTESLNVTMSANGLSQSRTSPLGESLLNLITRDE